jgi:hypothetical protein
VRLELAAAITGATRGRTPLFGPSVGEEFTYHQLDQALKLLLTEVALRSPTPCSRWARRDLAARPTRSRALRLGAVSRV